MKSQKFPFQNGTSHRSSVFYPLESSKTQEKSLFMLENIFPGTKLYLLCISMVLKQNKHFVFSIFRDVSFQKQMQQPPPGESILLKFCQNISNR